MKFVKIILLLLLFSIPAPGCAVRLFAVKLDVQAVDGFRDSLARELKKADVPIATDEKEPLVFKARISSTTEPVPAIGPDRTKFRYSIDWSLAYEGGQCREIDGAEIGYYAVRLVPETAKQVAHQGIIKYFRNKILPIIKQELAASGGALAVEKIKFTPEPPLYSDEDEFLLEE